MSRPLWQFIPKELIIRVKVPADTQRTKSNVPKQRRRLTGQKQLSETVITLNELFAKIAQSIPPLRGAWRGGGGADGLTQIGPDYSRCCYWNHPNPKPLRPPLTAESAIQSETHPNLSSLLVRAPTPEP